MEPQRWQRLRELFDAASELTPAEREAFLDSECRDDVELKAEVLSLLGHESATSDQVGEVIGAAMEATAVAPREHSLEPGRQLGRYEAVELLGVGGMGEVWLARDCELGRQVALKVVGPDLAANPSLRARFKREARALAALNHPNIVTVYSVEEVDNVLFLTMELVDGPTLKESIPKRGLEEAELLNMGLQLTEAVAVAHEHGITHRDLKPGNVMLDASKRVKVLDFGLAKIDDIEGHRDLQSETMTFPGMAMGTLPYMSPEQLEGRQVDARSDVFALGIVLFEMATGERPFHGDSAAGVISSILKEVPAKPDEMRPGLPRAFSSLVERCLAKDPSERWTDAGELHHALTEVATRRRRRLSWALAGAATLLALLLGAIALPPIRSNLGSAPLSSVESNPRSVSSLAVLPLLDLSQNEDELFLSEGMTEMLIGELSKLRQLKVISRTSAMRYKGTEKSIGEIARELDVEGVVEGSVTRLGDRVRVHVNLIRAADDRSLWTESYERGMGDLLTIQRQVARAIASELEVSLTEQESKSLQDGTSVSVEASEALLEAQHLQALFTSDSLPLAVERALRVTELEPGFAEGWASLAQTYLLAGLVAMPPVEAYPAALDAARRALELAPNLALADEALAWVAYHWQWDWDAAERHARRAVALNPGSASARQVLAVVLQVFGDFEAAGEHSRLSLELDPLSPLAGANRCEVLYRERRYQEALAQCERTGQLHPNHPMVFFHLINIHTALGARDRATELKLEMRRVMWGETPELQGVYERGGVRAYDEELRSRLASGPAHTILPHIQLAQTYLDLGDRETALDWLESSLSQRNEGQSSLGTAPIWDSLRGDPRFEAVLDRMELPFRISASDVSASEHAFE